MNPSDDSFYARIPALSDPELFNYIDHYSGYTMEAVQIAITEFKRRGHHLSNEKMTEIEKFLGPDLNPNTRSFNFDTSRFRSIAIFIFFIGMLSAIVIFFTAHPVSENALGFDPTDSRMYLHDLQVFGGKINIIAVEFTRWFYGLWQGKTLSFTVAFISIVIAYIFWAIGSHQPSDRKH
jgi:hypothetical protein